MVCVGWSADRQPANSERPYLGLRACHIICTSSAIYHEHGFQLDYLGAYLLPHYWLYNPTPGVKSARLCMQLQKYTTEYMIDTASFQMAQVCFIRFRREHSSLKRSSNLMSISMFNAMYVPCTNIVVGAKKYYCLWSGFVPLSGRENSKGKRRLSHVLPSFMWQRQILSRPLRMAGLSVDTLSGVIGHHEPALRRVRQAI